MKMEEDMKYQVDAEMGNCEARMDTEMEENAENDTEMKEDEEEGMEEEGLEAGMEEEVLSLRHWMVV
jgi:hypothetical protein